MPESTADHTADDNADHYQVLGVDATADQASIRQAYHRAARKWHPDRASENDGGRSEDQMRRVNEAWTVLGDPDKRRSYDRRLASGTASAGTGAGGRAGAGRSGAGVVGDDGVVRIDPRLLDTSYLAARRHAQEAEIAARRAKALGFAPIAALLVILVGIVVFTAYVRNPQEGGAITTTTVPGPGLGEGIEANDCVSVLAGGGLLERPCDANAHGRVIGARLPDGVCPLGTVSEVTLSNGVIACLGVVG